MMTLRTFNAIDAKKEKLKYLYVLALIYEWTTFTPEYFPFFLSSDRDVKLVILSLIK